MGKLWKQSFPCNCNLCNLAKVTRLQKHGKPFAFVWHNFFALYKKKRFCIIQNQNFIRNFSFLLFLLFCASCCFSSCIMQTSTQKHDFDDNFAQIVIFNFTKLNCNFTKFNCNFTKLWFSNCRWVLVIWSIAVEALEWRYNSNEASDFYLACLHTEFSPSMQYAVFGISMRA